MFIEKYAQLSNKDKELFAKVCNLLLSETFVIRYDYKGGNTDSRNQDYIFLSQNFEVVSEYLELSGWRLYKDDVNGIIYVENEIGTNKLSLTADQTHILLILRLIYDEHANVNVYSGVMTKVEEVLHQLVDVFHFFDKKPNMTEFKRSMKIFDDYNIIKIINGNYAEVDCDFVILPTIKIVVPAERMEMVANEVKALERSTDEEIK